MFADVTYPFRTRIDALVVPDPESISRELLDNGEYPRPITMRIADKNIRLLLAEDNPINVESARMILSQAGIETDTAENGKEAVKKVAEAAPGTYDAVLMDIQMPEMDGYTATRAIRALPDAAKARIPIIAMTANAFQEDVQMAVEAGMSGHIAKPLDLDRMMETLRTVLKAEGEAP